MSPTLVAAEENIDVWLTFYNEIDDQALLANYRELLIEEERGQEVRFTLPTIGVAIW